ncbi:ras guanyl releasing protein 3 [Trichuris trichiura]|uniref:Ras guanyl releasing protein 3 n=1 Tax=Trichuris trichiura TaxID=36087 RepID=A0A077Z2U6_TRITR|nr:ras guanyl releasing protein 3 [Trichuris trichiura]
MTDWYAKCDLANFRLEQKSLHMEDLVDQCLQSLCSIGASYKAYSLQIGYGSALDKKYEVYELSSIEPTGDHNDDPLVIAFVVLHEWYIGSVQLIDCVFRRLEKKPERWPSVVRLFNLWMQIYPQDFSIRSELCEAIDRLRQWASGNIASFCSSTSWSRYSSIKQPLSAKVSLSFDQWTPEDLAVNLTHIENKLLRRIPVRALSPSKYIHIQHVYSVQFRDYKSYAVNNHLNDESNLRKSIATFNSISQWIQCMILNKSKASERAEVITKFVRVAQNLKQLQNYNTLMAVVGALTHSAIARLSRTMVCVPNEVRLELLGYSNLLSSGSNFSVYRKVLCMSKGYRVPIIGVHLKDLISLHTAVPDYGDDKEINCQKFTQLFATFSHLIFDVQQPQQLPIPNESLTNTLKVALNIAYNDEEIYYLSLKREPKTLLQPSIQTSPVLADWAAGIQNRVDSSVMQKHVNAMVEAVFRHYDLNQDGYISKQEFDLIRSNFPLFDRFITLDSNRDGKISKREMKIYFMRFRCAQRRDSNHRFRVVNILTPTFCYHCKRLLWNVLRPELKCEDCGVAIHRNCEDADSSACFRRRNTEPPHRRRSRSETPSTAPKAANNYEEHQSAGIGTLFHLRRGRRRLQNNATAAPAAGSLESSPKLRSYSEGGQCYP